MRGGRRPSRGYEWPAQRVGGMDRVIRCIDEPSSAKNTGSILHNPRPPLGPGPLHTYPILEASPVIAKEEVISENGGLKLGWGDCMHGVHTLPCMRPKDHI